MESDSSFDFAASVNADFEVDQIENEDMKVENIVKTLEKRRLKTQQLQYFNGLFPQIHQEISLNVLAAPNSNMSLWPHYPLYKPLYVDILEKTEFNPLKPNRLDSLLCNIIDGSLEHIIAKEKKIKLITKLLLLKMSQLYKTLVLIRKELLKNRKKVLQYVWMHRPLDAVDTLYCFLLICGYKPSNIILSHVSRHLRILQTDSFNPFRTLNYLTNKLMEKDLVNVDLNDLIPSFHSCLVLNDIYPPQIYCYESKIQFCNPGP
eukprot:NODE_273_length_12179_cov_0.492632.p5 type:complete len:262 gc:universal NODE_273_length_12179_cov_0.492632:9436-8651(-)